MLLVSPDGSRRRRLASPTQPTHSDFVLMWSPDAAAIYVISALVAKPRLDSIDVRTGKSRKIADYPASLALVGLTTFSQSGSVSRDGRSFLTTVQNVKSDLWILEGFPQPRGRWF